MGPRGICDGKLAREYARALGLKQLVRRVPAVPSWEDYIRCLQSLTWPGMPETLRANLVFSGDGGSVGVGLDYVTEERIQWMRTGQRSRMIDFLVKKHQLPKTFLRDPICRELQDAIVEGITKEFSRFRSRDGGTDLWLFYMRNDQRRHLHTFWENIDRCRVEYLLPFYDAQFLGLILSGPIDVFLRHKFYHQWVQRFHPVFKSVAWQTYPGHLPCPVEMTVEGRLQWNKRRKDLFDGRNRDAFWQCAQALVRWDFPTEVLHRPRLFAAVLLHALRIRPYGWVFMPSADLIDVISKCTGIRPADGDEGTQVSGGSEE